MTEAVAEFVNISKTYKLYERPVDRLKEALNPLRRVYHKDFHALRNVTFSVRKGEALGIIGKNGSGKSTILKVLTGILTPTSGSVKVSGKISALLELGAGFNLEYSGLDNIYLNGTIMGLSHEQMTQRMNDILEFADIGEFVSQPVKTYSSGMFVRLAFAVAIHVDPDILIIDEALSVGDIRFQQKCFRKIEEFRSEGKTVIFVSHDLGTIVKFCDRAIWINDGQLVGEGAPLDVAKEFQAFMMAVPLTKYSDNTGSSTGEPTESSHDVIPIDPNLDVLGDGQAVITGLALIDLSSSRRTSAVVANQRVELLLQVRFNDNIDEPIVGFSVQDRLANVVAQTNSHVLGVALGTAHAGRTSVFQFQFSIPPLTNGHYTISPAIASGTQTAHVQHCWIHDALMFEVVNPRLFNLPGFIFLDDVVFKTEK